MSDGEMARRQDQRAVEEVEMQHALETCTLCEMGSLCRVLSRRVTRSDVGYKRTSLASVVTS